MRYKRIWAREYGVQYSECAIKALGPEVKEVMPVFMPDTLLFPERGNEVFCVDEEEFNLAINKIKNMQNLKDLSKLAGLFHKYGKMHVKIARSMGIDKLNKMNNNKLIESYNIYSKVWQEYNAFLWIIFYLADFYAESGQELIRKRGIEISVKESEALFSPNKRTGILELKDILMKFRKKGVKKLDKRILEDLTKEYSWIPCLDIINNPWQDKDLEDFYEHLELESEGLEFEEVAKKFNISGRDKAFFEQIKEVAYLKDHRDVYRRLGVYHSFPLFDEIAKRLKITRKEVAYLTSQEIVDALSGKYKIDLNEIKKRMNGFLLYREGDKVKINSDVQFIDKFVKENIIGEEHKEIKGIIANRGLVRGTAKVITSVKDLSKIVKGEIMVSITTHPDFVPAMQKASAFVTDEGGMMSHAAIVSREMNKPCVVGTKSATRLIKDGDMIEVDANRGIVKVIK